MKTLPMSILIFAFTAFEDDIISRKMRFSEYVEYFTPVSSEISKGRVNVITGM